MMNDNNEMYVTQEERDPKSVEGVLRHSVRLEETPVTLVQLPDAEELSQDSDFPLRQRRLTIINTVRNAQTTMSGEDVDPFEWHFLRNTPNLRTSLHQERAVDELTSRRKSRIFGDPTEQTVLTLSNQNVKECQVMFNVEHNDNDRSTTEVGSKTSQWEVETEQLQSNAPKNMYSDSSMKSNNGFGKGISNTRVKTQMESASEGLDGIGDNDEIGHSLEEDVNVTSASPHADIIVDEKNPISTTLKSSMGDTNEEIIVMPAAYSSADQKSPFTKDRDELKPKPSSRVRVLIMVDQWDEGDSLEDEDRKKRDGRKNKYKDNDPRNGRGSYDESPTDSTRRETIYDKSPLGDKRYDKSRRGSQSGDYESDKRKGKKHGSKDADSYKSTESNQRRRPGDKGYDDDESKQGTRTGYNDKGLRGSKTESDRKKHRGGRRSRVSDDERSGDNSQKQGKRPGDKGYDKKKPRDVRRSRGSDDEGFDDDAKKRGKRPGEKEYDKKKPRDARRSRGSDDEGFDDDAKKQGKRPGEKEYEKKKPRDARRSRGSDDEGFDDDAKKQGKRPGDKNKHGDGTESRERFDEADRKKGGKPEDRSRTRSRQSGKEDDHDGRSEKSRGRERPRNDHEVNKYRMVEMPKSATNLTSRRRYHMQITDHDMKEPWFNSCFNISKENNVDFKYEGPVKITPYYVADKFY